MRLALSARCFAATCWVALVAFGVGATVTALRAAAAWASGGESFALVLGAGLLMTLETAVVIAPALGWALCLSSSHERGELRALAALGVSPLQLVASTVPALLLVGGLVAAVSAGWGAIAAAPGELTRRVSSEARDACLAEATQRGHGVGRELPFGSLSWVCFPGGDAYVVGATAAARGAPVFAAEEVRTGAETDALELRAATLWWGAGTSSAVRVRAERVVARRTAPLLSPSNLPYGVRSALWGATSVGVGALAALLGLTVLANAEVRRARAILLSSAMAGAAASVLTFSSLEGAARSVWMYALVPAMGCAGATLACAVGRTLLARRMPKQGGGTFIAGVRRG